jgi:hypothetical protein
MIKKLLALTSVGALLAFQAFAGPVNSGYYAGLSLGSVTGDLTQSSIYNTSLDEIAIGGSQSKVTNVFGANFFVGYNINTYFGVELGYLSTGQFEIAANGENVNIIDQTTFNSVNFVERVTGFDAMLVGHLPLAQLTPKLQGVSVYAKAGMAMLSENSTGSSSYVTTNNATGEVTSGSFSGTQTTSGTVFAYGLGADYALPMVQGLHVSLDYFSTQSYENADRNNYGYIPALQMIGLGVTYHF